MEFDLSSDKMKYGRAEGKKLILQADVGGSVDQNELWAILDTVDSDLEEDIDNLLADSDTEYETITDAAATLMEKADNNVERHLLAAKTSLEAVVHTDVQSVFPSPNVVPSTSHQQSEVPSKRCRKGSTNKEQNAPPIAPPISEGSTAPPAPSIHVRHPCAHDPSRPVRNTIEIEKIEWDRRKAPNKSIQCDLSDKVAFEIPDTVNKKDPVELFYSYGDFSILCSNIASESNRYARQNGREYTCTGREIEVFIGVTYFMGLKVLPSLKDYWRTDELGVPFVRNSMSRSRYMEIRSNLHFSNNHDPLHSNDKAAKIRPLIEHLNHVYQRYSKPVCNQSIDEHMVKFKGHHSMKQYIKNKPIKWGIKFWLRSDAATGYLYEFDIYTGRKDSRELGLGENVVMSLTTKLNGTGVTIYADNYFSSPTLAVLLRDRGINYVGVVRKDRKGLPSFKEEKRMARGEHDMLYCKEENLMALKWIDNKPVHIISSVINHDISHAERRIKGHRERIRVECPELIKMYNRYMGGVDLNDRLKSTYEQDRRGRRWYLRLAFDMLDQLMVNSRILFNTLNTENQLIAKEYHLLIARGIVDEFSSRNRAVYVAPKKLKQATSTQAIAHDHMPIFGPRGRCKHCAGTGKDLKSFIHCSTCSIALCLNKERNCFYQYHQGE